MADEPGRPQPGLPGHLHRHLRLPAGAGGRRSRSTTLRAAHTEVDLALLVAFDEATYRLYPELLA